jgi:hypothetical protein
MQNRSRFVFEDDGLVPNDPMPFDRFVAHFGPTYPAGRTMS